MRMHTLIDLSDVAEAPLVKITLPPITPRVGERIQLNFKLERWKGGRLEALYVVGFYRVRDFHIHAAGPGAAHPVLKVEAAGKVPVWRAIRKPEVPRLAPARSRPTQISE